MIYAHTKEIRVRTTTASCTTRAMYIARILGLLFSFVPSKGQSPRFLFFVGPSQTLRFWDISKTARPKPISAPKPNRSQNGDAQAQ